MTSLKTGLIKLLATCLFCICLIPAPAHAGFGIGIGASGGLGVGSLAGSVLGGQWGSIIGNIFGGGIFGGAGCTLTLKGLDCNWRLDFAIDFNLLMNAPTIFGREVSSVASVYSYGEERLEEGTPPGLDWDGSSELIQATRSPILFNPESEEAQKSKYPEFAYNEGYHDKGSKKGSKKGAREASTEGDKESITGYQFGTDEQIVKATMKGLMPLSNLQGSNINDPYINEYFLSVFTTLRGVTDLTLAYLDKTVAASLHSTYGQNAEWSKMQITQNIAQANMKTASPRLWQMLRDQDEKVTMCLLGLKAKDKGERGRYRWDDELCKSECNEKFLAKGAKVDEKKRSLSFEYCQCCSRVSSTVNASFGDKEGKKFKGDNSSPTAWSLVDRVFYGADLIDKDAGVNGSDEDIKKKVDQMVAFFKNTYGDYELDQDGDNPFTSGGKKSANTVGGASASKKSQGASGLMKMSFVPPLDDLPEIIQKFRNGCVKEHQWDDPKTGIIDPQKVDDPKTLDPCEETTGVVAFGIYDSFINVLRCAGYPPLQKIWDKAGGTTFGSSSTVDGKGCESVKPEVYKAFWIEATLGTVFTASDLKAIIARDNLLGDMPLGTKWVPRKNGEIYRVVKAFADASALSAFKKVHASTVNIVRGHIAQNTTLDAQDKQMISSLMNRVGEAFSLHELYVRSEDNAKAVLLGARIEGDRQMLAEGGAASEAANAALRGASRRSNIVSGFGTPSKLVSPGG